MQTWIKQYMIGALIALISMSFMSESVRNPSSLQDNIALGVMGIGLIIVGYSLNTPHEK